MVRRESAKLLYVGSIPTQASKLIKNFIVNAAVVEQADTRDLKSLDRKVMRVRFSPAAQKEERPVRVIFLCRGASQLLGWRERIERRSDILPAGKIARRWPARGARRPASTRCRV